MDVVIKRAPQIVHDPLAGIGGEIVFQVGTDCTDNSDGRHRSHCKVEDLEFILAKYRWDEPLQPARKLFGLQNIVDDDFDGPRFEYVAESLAQYGNERQTERFPVRTNEVADVRMSDDGRILRHALCLFLRICRAFRLIDYRSSRRLRRRNQFFALMLGVHRLIDPPHTGLRSSPRNGNDSRMAPTGDNVFDTLEQISPMACHTAEY